MTKDEKIILFRKKLKEINSPLSDLDAGLLAEYGQCGEPHKYEDYIAAKRIWDEINK